jgi:hypothetical protein
MHFGERPFGRDFDALRRHIRSLADDAAEPTGSHLPSVTLDCDGELRYEYVVRAITAVSGYVRGSRIRPLVRDVKFAIPGPR